MESHVGLELALKNKNWIFLTKLHIMSVSQFGLRPQVVSLGFKTSKTKETDLFSKTRLRDNQGVYPMGTEAAIDRAYLHSRFICWDTRKLFFQAHFIRPTTFGSIKPSGGST